MAATGLFEVKKDRAISWASGISRTVAGAPSGNPPGTRMQSVLVWISVGDEEIRHDPIPMFTADLLHGRGGDVDDTTFFEQTEIGHEEFQILELVRGQHECPNPESASTCLNIRELHVRRLDPDPAPRGVRSRECPSTPELGAVSVRSKRPATQLKVSPRRADRPRVAAILCKRCQQPIAEHYREEYDPTGAEKPHRCRGCDRIHDRIRSEWEERVRASRVKVAVVVAVIFVTFLIYKVHQMDTSPALLTSSRVSYRRAAPAEFRRETRFGVGMPPTWRSVASAPLFDLVSGQTS